MRRIIPFGIGAAVVLAALALGAGTRPAAPIRIAAVLSLTGTNSTVDPWFLDGIRMAVDEANADKDAPPIELTVYDDQGTADGAREVALKIAAGDELMVVGPTLTTSSNAAGAIFAEAGIASLVPTAHGDSVTDNATTFRPLYSTSELGAALANHLRHVLGGTRAIVLYTDSNYGRPVAEGFLASAKRLGIEASALAYGDEAGAQRAARQALKAGGNPAIVLAALYDEARPLLLTLRRGGFSGPILGVSGMAADSFAEQFADEPEERDRHGFFTETMMAASPVLLDSAGAETVAFAARFRARLGKEPIWRSMQSYDAARLAIAAARTAAASKTADRRDAARAALAKFDSPARAMKGVTGPVWFTAERGRKQAVRMGAFHGGRFESAPLQLVPVTKPSREQIALGAVVDMGNGIHARRQQVVYTGIYLNALRRVDVAQGTFSADFYLWMRYGQSAGPGAAEPTDIEFPDMVRGSFDPRRTAAESVLPDGTTYKLWRISGDFKSGFDLRRFPSDTQHLGIRLFNARAASDGVIYAQDRRTFDASGAMAAPSAFEELSAWEVSHTGQGRDIMATASPLGDTRLNGAEGGRELSGFRFTVDIHRQVLATIGKSMLPLGLLCLILFATLYLPPANVAPRVAAVITATLTGSVLMSNTNAQLGNVGYPIAIESVFYLFFLLCLICMVAVILAERLRIAGKQPAALVAEHWSQRVFLATLMLGSAGAWYVIAG